MLAAHLTSSIHCKTEQRGTHWLMAAAVLGEIWVENIVTNTKIAQFTAWLLVQMGNVRRVVVLRIAGTTAANHRDKQVRQEGTSLQQSLGQLLIGDFPTCQSRTAPIG